MRKTNYLEFLERNRQEYSARKTKRKQKRQALLTNILLAAYVLILIFAIYHGCKSWGNFKID